MAFESISTPLRGTGKEAELTHITDSFDRVTRQQQCSGQRRAFLAVSRAINTDSQRSVRPQTPVEQFFVSGRYPPAERTD